MLVTRCMTVNDRAQAVYPKTCVDHFPSNAHIIPHFESARGNADGTTVRQRTSQPIDKSASHTVARELGCDGETNRACPNDQDIYHVRFLSSDGWQARVCHHLVPLCRSQLPLLALRAAGARNDLRMNVPLLTGHGNFPAFRRGIVERPERLGNGEGGSIWCQRSLTVMAGLQ